MVLGRPRTRYTCIPTYPLREPNNFCQRIKVEFRNQVAKRHTICKQAMPDSIRKRRRTGSLSNYTSVSPATGLGLDALGRSMLHTTESTGSESTVSIGSACTYRDAGTQTERVDQAPSGFTATGTLALYLQGSFEEVSRTYIKSIYLGRPRDGKDH
jgi:hypothetical protein